MTSTLSLSSADYVEDFSNDVSTRTETNDRLRKVITESERLLQQLGIDSTVPKPDLTAPPVHDPIFPEEYNIETETGLVKVQTLILSEE